MNEFVKKPSIWLRDVDFDSYRTSSLPKTVEVAIVGGGLMGVATAYWLAKAGANVAVIEKDDLAWGASGRNAGMMLASQQPLDRQDLVNTVLMEEEIEAGLIQPGHLALASSQVIWEKICVEADRRVGSESPIYALDRCGCEDLLKLKINKRFFGGRWFPRGSVIHPAKFVYGLAIAAAGYGAKFVTGNSVHNVRTSDGNSIVDTDFGCIVSTHLVFACGAETASFLETFLPVLMPARGQVMSTQPLPFMFPMGMAVDWGTIYWRQNTDGKIVIGGYRNLDLENETGKGDHLNSKIQQALAEFLPEAFPGFPDIRVEQRWSGIMDCTPDGKPVIGAVPGVLNQWVIAGFGGHGMPCGLGAGKALSEAIISLQTPKVLNDFDPARFTGNICDVAKKP